MRALFIGNITLDVFDGKLRVGGPGFYGGRALSDNLCVETYVLSNVDEVHRGLILGIMNIYGIRILEIEAKEMPIFVIRGGKAVEFHGISHRISQQVVESYLRAYRFDIVILAPIMKELDIDVVGIARRYTNKVLSIDIQGFVRTLAGDNIVCSWVKVLEDALVYADVVHGNIAEFCFAISERDVIKRIVDLSSTCKTLFLVSLDYRGSYAIHQREVFYIPSLPVAVVDDVGAGDVLLATTSYFIARNESTIDASVKGVIAASLKVENAYKSWFDIETIEAVHREHVQKVQVIKL